MSDVFGIGGAVQGAASIAGAAMQASAIKDAAAKQAESAKYAQDLIQGRYDTTRGDFSPYRDIGTTGKQVLLDVPGELQDFLNTGSQYTTQLQQNTPTVPGAMTQAELEATPGYQFTRDQGLKATQNAAAARGLGVSGAALKGAATYATGLSDQTYNTRFSQQQQLFGNQQTKFGDIQNLFSNEQTLKSNAWNRLAGMINTGLSAAGQTATLGASAAAQGAQIAQNAGNAQAAAGIAGANAISGGINGAANAFNQNQQLNRLLGDNGSIYGSNGAVGTGISGSGTSYDPSGYSAADQRQINDAYNY